MGIFSKIFGNRNRVPLQDAIHRGAFLVDVRSAAEFSAGSVQGATNIPLEKVSSQLSKFKGKQGIVVFCRSGVRSDQAKRILERNGISQVINGGSMLRVHRAMTNGA